MSISIVHTQTLAEVHRALIKEQMSTRLHDQLDWLNGGNHRNPVDTSTASHTIITFQLNTLPITVIEKTIAS